MGSKALVEQQQMEIVFWLYIGHYIGDSMSQYVLIDVLLFAKA